RSTTGPDPRSWSGCRPRSPVSSASSSLGGGGTARPDSSRAAARPRAWSGSELPEDRDHSAQDGGVLSGDGAECRVVWEEPDARGILAERLDGGFAADHRGYDLAVVRDVLPTHHDVAPVAERVVAHRLAHDLEHEELS